MTLSYAHVLAVHALLQVDHKVIREQTASPPMLADHSPLASSHPEGRLAHSCRTQSTTGVDLNVTVQSLKPTRRHAVSAAERTMCMVFELRSTQAGEQSELWTRSTDTIVHYRQDIALSVPENVRNLKSLFFGFWKKTPKP